MRRVRVTIVAVKKQ